jgi:hypothetical protein
MKINRKGLIYMKSIRNFLVWCLTTTWGIAVIGQVIHHRFCHYRRSTNNHWCASSRRVSPGNGGERPEEICQIHSDEIDLQRKASNIQAWQANIPTTPRKPASVHALNYMDLRLIFAVTSGQAWCRFVSRPDGLALSLHHVRLAALLREGEAASDAYRKGCQTAEIPFDAVSPMDAGSLVLRQALGGAAGDLEPRKEPSGNQTPFRSAHHPE